MAVAAEMHTYEPDYRLVDAIPEAYQQRQAVRVQAEAVLEERRDRMTAGEVMVSVDVLSTAHRVLAAGRWYGQGSPQQIELFEGLKLDSHRALAEWYRKNTAEYFPPERHTFDDATRDFYSNGLSTGRMTENGIVPIPDSPEDEARRVNEHVEERTPQILRSLGCVAIGTDKIRTVSECTDKAIVDYNDDVAAKRPARSSGGQVPKIAKLMIRDMGFDADSSDRFQEQVAISGLLVTHEIIQKTLERAGLAVAHMDKTELHAAQILARDDLMDFIRRLDTVASEEWCTSVFMGEQVSQDHPKNYETFRQEALRRQEGLWDIAETVAQFVLDLARDNVDRRAAPAMVEKFIKLQLLELGKESTEIAEHMFDRETAQGLQEVARLESIGKQELAFELMRLVTEAAPNDGYCGAGSCGLEAVNVYSESGQALAKKVGAAPGDIVVRDTERRCRCGKKAIVYSYTTTRVNKYCTACTAFESKVSVAATA